MATYSNVFAWKITWTEKPGGVQSVHVSKSQTPPPPHTHTYHLTEKPKLFSQHSIKTDQILYSHVAHIILEKTEFEKISGI